MIRIFVLLAFLTVMPGTAFGACPLHETDGEWVAAGEIVMMGYDRVWQTPIVLFEVGPNERCVIDIAGFDGYKFPKSPSRVMLAGVVLGGVSVETPCRVVGRVYGGRDDPSWDMERISESGCMVVELSDDQGLLWITNPAESSRHVTIAIPSMPGWQRLDYVWGSPRARLNGREVTVRQDPPEAWMPRRYLVEWSLLEAS